MTRIAARMREKFAAPVRWARVARSLARELHGMRGYLEGELDQVRAELAASAVRQAELERGLSEATRAAARAAVRSLDSGPMTRVVFLVHNEAAWACLADVVEIMRCSDDFEPIVISVPRHFGGLDEGDTETKVHGFLRARGVPHVRVPRGRLEEASLLLDALDPGVIFRQSQWDADYPTEFSTARLSRIARLAYIPYEVVNLVENVESAGPGINTAVDSERHNSCWRFYCASELVREAASRTSLLGGRQMRVVGHPKVDHLRSRPATWPFPPSGRPRILWSAHHSVHDDWTRFGLWPVMKDTMLQWAARADDLEFVFVHHPMLPASVSDSDRTDDPEAYERWVQEWSRLPNASAEDNDDCAGLLVAADIVVTVGISVLLEAQIADCDVVFAERPGHRQFNEIGRLALEGVHEPVSADQVPDAVRSILENGRGSLRASQERVIEALLGEPGAARRIVEDLRSSMRDGPVTAGGGDGRCDCGSRGSGPGTHRLR